ncbi:hypothetical protein OIN60_17670 [Paenibacillus sp. P96]|uniref:ABC transporter permease n=1 Tax=Paenibacillus zeirhizosphaerae TaxID=2987519 RepID=A0ABT9FV06_9BACL|nr:hypothetical protein [Paenibacillus sp. P96]MDP4098564.1 hypothetical protein [Paenibacillus sp. P96]
MAAFKQAWRITMREFSADRYVALWTLIFIAYLALLTSFVINAQLERESFKNPVADFMLLALIPFLGFIFNHRAFKYLQEDSYTQMLAYFRLLPVGARTVITSRIQQAILAFLANGTLYFAMLFLTIEPLRVIQSLGFYVSFGLTWIGYGMIVNSLYMYLEFLVKGKTYFWLSLWIMGSSVIVAAIVRICGGNMILWTRDMSLAWGVASPAMWLALAAGTGMMLLSSRLMLRKLIARDLV